MPATYQRTETDWRTTLRDAWLADDPALADLLTAAARDLATYHPALNDSREKNLYTFLLHLDDASWDHYDAAHDEADAQFDDNDRVICRVYNVAWAAIYLYYVDQFESMLYGTPPNTRLVDPATLTK